MCGFIADGHVMVLLLIDWVRSVTLFDSLRWFGERMIVCAESSSCGIENVCMLFVGGGELPDKVS